MIGLIVQPASTSVGSGLDLYSGRGAQRVSKPLKQATTVSEQIELLTQRGMIVDNDLAVQWLANVSYYRLSAYWYPARLVNLDGTRSDRCLLYTSPSPRDRG